MSYCCIFKWLLSSLFFDIPQVITAEQFEHLGLLLKAKNASLENMHLCQAAPFFANSDPDMPAAPVPVAQVLEWVQQHICAASENLRGTQKLSKEETVVKDTALVESSSSEATDVAMADATASPVSPTPSNTQTILVPNGVLHLSKDWRPDGMTFVDGVMKASVLKRENDIKGESVKVGAVSDTQNFVAILPNNSQGSVNVVSVACFLIVRLLSILI